MVERGELVRLPQGEVEKTSISRREEDGETKSLSDTTTDTGRRRLVPIELLGNRHAHSSVRGFLKS